MLIYSLVEAQYSDCRKTKRDMKKETNSKIHCKKLCGKSKVVDNCEKEAHVSTLTYYINNRV